MTLTAEPLYCSIYRTRWFVSYFAGWFREDKSWWWRQRVYKDCQTHTVFQTESVPTEEGHDLQQAHGWLWFLCKLWRPVLFTSVWNRVSVCKIRVPVLRCSGSEFDVTKNITELCSVESLLPAGGLLWNSWICSQYAIPGKRAWTNLDLMRNHLALLKQMLRGSLDLSIFKIFPWDFHA